VNTDHLPIISSLDLSYTLSSNPIHFNYRTINWDTYCERLQENLNKVEAELTTPLDAPADLEQATNLLFKAISKTTSVTICR
jgi:hypothetical protein